MRFTRALVAAFIFCLLLSVAGTPARTSAEQAELPVTETLSLPIGTIFEIVAVHDLRSPVINWSLTRGQTFLQASRERIFRVRFIEPGTYTLTGEVRESDGSKRSRLLLTIQIAEGVPPLTAQGTGSGIVALTMPASDAFGRVPLGTGQQFLRIFPSPSVKEDIVVDLHADVDEDKDGNARNDQAAPGTFFSTTRSTPLTLWFTTPVTNRTLTFSLRGKVDTEEELFLLSPDEARKDDALRERERQRQEDARTRIIVSQFGSGAVKFSLNVESEDYASAPLLVHWNFGDGSQSLLDAPIHRFPRNGTFAIVATVRNLRTGEEMADFTLSLDVQDVPAITPPTIGETGGEQPGQTAADGGTGGEPAPGASRWELSSGILRRALTFLAGIILSVGVGFLITLIIRFIKRKGGIKGAVDRAETALVGTPAKPDTLSQTTMALSQEEEGLEEAALPPQELPAAPAPSPEPSQEQSLPAEVPPTVPEEPEPQGTPAPSWLTQGLEQASASGQTQTTMPPAAAAESTALQEAAPDVPASPPLENGAPPWLVQEAPTTTMPPPAIPAATEEPAPAPTPPAPSAEPALPPVQTEHAPLWLQQGLSATPSPPAEVPAATAMPLQPPSPAAAPSTPSPAQATEAPAPQAQPSPAAPAKKSWDAMTPEERELERKRLKRQRYRRNKRERERQEKQAPATPGEPSTPSTPEPPAPSAPPPPLEEHPILPADDDVKFVVGADSVSPVPPVSAQDDAAKTIGGNMQ